MEEKKCMSKMIAALSAGESIAFPLEKHASVRVLCYNIGLTYGRTYSANANRADRIITVTRTA
jgi:hypothetical protein